MVKEPHEVSQELTKLYKKHGHLRPSLVVDAARSKESRLHDYFDWDDRSAAEKYRRRQAANLIHEYLVEVEPGILQRSFAVQEVPVTIGPRPGDGPSREGVHLPLSVISADEQYYLQVRAGLVKKIQALQESLRQLDEAAKDAGIVDAASNNLMIEAAKFLRDLQVQFEERPRQ